MLYRGELVAGGQTIAAQNYQNVTHPRQAMRRIVDQIRTSRMPVNYMTVYVLNEEGQVWMFVLQRKNERFEATEVQKTSVLLPKPMVMSVFAGNTSVHEVVGE